MKKTGATVNSFIRSKRGQLAMISVRRLPMRARALIDFVMY